MPSSNDTPPQKLQVLPAQHRRGRRRRRGQHQASIVKSEARPPSKRESLEETAAVVKIVGEYTKMLVDSPGVVAFLQGHGQAAAANAERLTLGQAQNHERQMLLMKQNHERQLELDRMQEQAKRHRVRVWFAAVLLAITCGALVIASIRLDWIDGKTLMGVSTAVGVLIAAILRMNSSKASGTSSAPPPPAQTP